MPPVCSLSWPCLSKWRVHSMVVSYTAHKKGSRGIHGVCIQAIPLAWHTIPVNSAALAGLAEGMRTQEALHTRSLAKRRNCARRSSMAPQ